MKIAGLVKTSLIDYPDLVSAVIFTQGCNFACGFCHNPDLVPRKGEESIQEDDLFSFLTTRVTRLDGVVITGGEPTVQPDLGDFIRKIKQMGFMVKLDTNGTNPEMLEDLIKAKLIDYIAMDIKGPLEKYREICGLADTKVVQTSIKTIMESGLDHEFRTTYLPVYHRIEDAAKIGELIEGARLYSIQNFRPGNTLNAKLKNETGFKLVDLQKMKELVKPHVQNVRILDNL